MNPKQWETKKIGDLVSLEYGAGLIENDRSGVGYPVYGSNGIVGYHGKYMINGPGIIVGRKGSVGAVHWSSNSFWPIDTAYYVNTQKDIDLRWFYWSLQFLGLNRLDSSTGVPGLNRNDVYRLKLEEPTHAEQYRIAEIIDTIDDTIQRTEQLIAKLKSVKQGLLHDLLTRGLDENGQLRDPIAHPEQFKDSPLGIIPNEWDVYPINEIGKIVGGTTPSRVVPSYWGGIIPWITPTDMSKLRTDYISGGQDWLTQKGLDSCSAYLLPIGSIVVTTRATLGLAAITQRELATNQGFKNIITNDGWDNRFVCYKIRALSNEMVRRASGTTFLEISGTQFALLEIAAPAPGSNEQDMIASAIAAHNQRIATEEIYLEKLKAIKKGLMHDLLTGKVMVNLNKEEQENEDLHHS
jgi:type I restriction enzyme S subunit